MKDGMWWFLFSMPGEFRRLLSDEYIGESCRNI